MDEPRTSRVLDNATRLIDALVANGPLTAAEIAGLIEIPRPTAYRLIEALLAIDLVRSLPDGRTGLSLRWLGLADAARLQYVAHSQHEALTALAQATGQTVFYSLPRGTSAVCVDWAQGRGIELLLLRPGRELPLYAGAAGRLVLAHLAEADLTEYLRQAPFPAFTAKTLTHVDELRADARTTREQGYSLSDEDVTPSIGAVGVPVLAESGELVGCVSLAGAARDISRHLERYLIALRACAQEITLH